MYFFLVFACACAVVLCSLMDMIAKCFCSAKFHDVQCGRRNKRRRRQQHAKQKKEKLVELKTRPILNECQWKCVTISLYIYIYLNVNAMLYVQRASEHAHTLRQPVYRCWFVCLSVNHLNIVCVQFICLQSFCLRSSRSHSCLLFSHVCRKALVRLHQFITHISIHTHTLRYVTPNWQAIWLLFHGCGLPFRGNCQTIHILLGIQMY